MTTHLLKTASTVKSFIQGGNATFTLVSLKTGTRFTYRVRESEDGNCFFVGLLSGPNNEADYAYLGIIRRGVFMRTPKSRIGETAPSYLAFKWAYGQLAKGILPGQLECWHEGRCCRCGRTLTVPESIADGIGPECRKFAGAKAAPLLECIGA